MVGRGGGFGWRHCGEAVGIFGVFFEGKGGGFGYVAEGVAAQDVTIGLCADDVIAVIGAGDGDLV